MRRKQLIRDVDLKIEQNERKDEPSFQNPGNEVICLGHASDWMAGISGVWEQTVRANIASATKRKGAAFRSRAFVTQHDEISRNLILSPSVIFLEIWGMLVATQILGKAGKFMSERKAERG